MLKKIILVMLILPGLHANSYLIRADKGNIELSIKGIKKHLCIKEGYTEPLDEGDIVTLVKGPGIARIKNNNKLHTELSKEGMSCTIPSRSFTERMVDLKNKAIAYLYTSTAQRDGVSRGDNGKNIKYFDINVSHNVRYYSLYSKSFGPTPVKLTLINNDKTIVRSYTFYEKDYEIEDDKLKDIIFFSIPTKYLQRGQSYKIEAGVVEGRKSHLRAQGKINIVP